MVDRLHLADHEPSAVLAIGPVAFDTIITPTQEGERVLGGSGAFASLAASYFAPTRLVGLVGEDFGDEYINRFVKRGIDVSGLKKGKGKTFYWKGRYFEDFNKRETLQLDLNILENFTPELTEEFKNTPYVFIGSVDPDLQMNAIRELADEPFIVVDIIDHWIKTKRKEFLEVIKQVDLLFINDSEACVLAQEGSSMIAGQKLRELGAKTVVMKKGEHGALLFHEEGIFAAPSYPVMNLKDPTGAGDAFAGALIGYLAAVNKTDFFNLKHGVIYATAVASLAIEDFSWNRLESAGPKAIEERYETLLKMMTF